MTSVAGSNIQDSERMRNWRGRQRGQFFAAGVVAVGVLIAVSVFVAAMPVVELPL